MCSIDFLGDEFYIIVEAEDAGDEQEGLGNIDQQAIGHVIDHDDLIRHQRNAAHDEQHRTGILRDFKARIFHSDLHEGCFACCAEDGGDDVTCNLKNDFYGLTHNFSMF